MTTASPTRIRRAAEWAHDAARRRAAGLAAPPAVRAPLACRDDTLVLVCHASPGSRRRASTRRLDPSVTIERVTRTDARVICCGHTHVPEVRDLGWKLIVNAGSAGYVVRRRPDRLLGARRHRRRRRDRRDPPDRRSTRSRSPNAISARGLPGDVYRAATVRTGKLVR